MFAGAVLRTQGRLATEAHQGPMHQGYNYGSGIPMRALLLEGLSKDGCMPPVFLLAEGLGIVPIQRGRQMEPDVSTHIRRTLPFATANVIGRRQTPDVSAHIGKRLPAVRVQ